MMGAERRSMVMSEEIKESTAYHEAGHAVVGRLVPEHDPVYKVSIIPRGRALGVTMYLPEQDRVSMSKQHLESMISSLYGGRLAEELIYGKEKVSTGASNDIERATEIARKMVTQWGFSEKLGPMLYAEDEGEVFLGRSVTQTKHMSDDTAKLIDDEVRQIIDRNYERARQIIMDNMDIMHAMKDALMKYETIDAGQIDDLMARKPVIREPAGWGEQSKTPSAPEVKAEPEAKAEESTAETASSDVATASEKKTLNNITLTLNPDLFGVLCLQEYIFRMLKISHADKQLELHSPVVMGILNTTPDSFSDGGRYVDLDVALARAQQMIDLGVAIIDIGGESTRPGAPDVALEEELQRVIPLIKAIRKQNAEVWISIDTSKAEVMRQALAAGADLINDVRALQSRELLK